MLQGNELVDYWADTAQRTVLTLDVLRQRGNQFLEHYEAGKPPVLVFDYDVVLDGKDLERPSNYLLLRIRPEEGCPTDPRKRPYVVFDPRAGHGPGIGGSKEASQVGVALRAGHPVYFVSFRPQPVDGQTLNDVAYAERCFLEKVTELHPEAESKPAIVGNCQAGWAIMMLSAYAPDLASVIGISGAPLSYWAGVEGKNPMRYLGGLMGGNWLASLAADLGNGVFDGVNLVSNFEGLNPANTLLRKPYNLYSKVDTEAPRFLGFERWWGGYFMLTREEIEAITSELFVGNKLTQGKLVAADGTRIDLRAIRAPIVVVCSEGDNITPPPQALNWVLDLYDSVDEIRANEQTIVYTVHPSVGHLGIFVSSKVALKEHAELVNSLDLIETLAPGLYEMVIEDAHLEGERGSTEHLEYDVRFEARTLDDVRAFDDGRDDETAFHTVAKLSEANQGLYRQFVSPWVRAMVNPQSAEFMRIMNPYRQAHLWFSDLNPWMAGVKWLAEQVREQRVDVPADNPYRAAEAAMADRIEASLERWTEARDLGCERLFKAIWTQPTIRALVGEEASFADVKKPRARWDKAFHELAMLKLRGFKYRQRQGSFAEAILRVVYAAVKLTGRIDERGYLAAREIWRSHPRLNRLSRAAFLAEAKEAALMVAFDEEHALTTLPHLLPTAADRQEALDVLRRMGTTRGDSLPRIQSLLQRVEEILGAAGSAAAASEAAPPPAAAGNAAPPPAADAEATESAPARPKAAARRAPAQRRPAGRRTAKPTA